jgi:uncharacterized protein YndB with AHSA1/START domain
MTPMTDSTADIPVRKTITVDASPDDAFRVFTDGIDSWWPRQHHIGKAPLKRVIIEGRAGGRCYNEQTDDEDCDWGSVIVWDPPRRLVFAWKIDAQWQYEPDLAKSSEVEVRFTPEAGGKTRVDLEHRFFDRLGPAGAGMRTMVDSPSGWGETLGHFARVAGGKKA